MAIRVLRSVHTATRPGRMPEIGKKEEEPGPTVDDLLEALAKEAQKLIISFSGVARSLVMGYNVAQRWTMSANGVVRARIDKQIKSEATAVLASLGLTVSDAFRLLLTRVAREQALPFEPLTPNEETIEAMREARKGGLPAFQSIEALMADLNADH